MRVGTPIRGVLAYYVSCCLTAFLVLSSIGFESSGWFPSDTDIVLATLLIGLLVAMLLGLPVWIVIDHIRKAKWKRGFADSISGASLGAAAYFLILWAWPPLYWLPLLSLIGLISGIAYWILTVPIPIRRS